MGPISALRLINARSRRRSHGSGRGAGLAEQCAVPSVRLAQRLLVARAPPDHAQRCGGGWLRFRALRIADGVRAWTIRIEDAEQPAQVDLLPRGVEDVRCPDRRDPDAKRRAGATEV